MITETFAAKAALCVASGALGYLALDRFCQNAGIQEPLSATARVAFKFCGNLNNEFNSGSCSGLSNEQKAIAEMAAREAYALALAKATPAGGSSQGVTICTK